jgi:curved DNA-binding protein CbpA
MAKDYYSILSVARSANPDEIRERFRQLARERHPDRFQGEERAQAEGAFQEITEAFNVLSNPERRRQHDLELARPTAEAGGETPRLTKFHLEAGVAFYRDGNFVQAAENFEKVTELDPQNHQAWHHLAQSLAHQRRNLAKAVSAIAKACELNPVSVQYLKLAGRLHAEAGIVDKAERYYNEALALGGEDPAVTKALEGLRARSKKGWSGLFGRGS